MKQLVFVLLVLAKSLFSQEIYIQASEEKEYNIADFINAKVIYKDLSESQIEEFRNYRNYYITSNLLLVEFLAEGPPDEFLFIASFSKDEHELELEGESVRVSYDNFSVNTSYNKPPDKFNYNFLSSEIIERYIKQIIIIIGALFLICIPFILIYRKRAQAKSKFFHQQNEWKAKLSNSNLDRVFLEQFLRDINEIENYFDFEKTKLNKFKVELNKIQYKQNWTMEELKVVIQLYSNFVRDFRDKSWNTNLQT